MKKIIYSLFSLLLFFSLIQKAHANVTQGSSSSTVDVETDVNGSGSVTTHVQTDVNGKTQVFDTNQPGKYHIENNGSTASAVKVSPIQTPNASSTPQPHKELSANFFISVWDHVKNLFKNIIRFF